MTILSISRDWGVDPSIVRISTDDTLQAITAPFYLTTQETNIQEINAGIFQWNDNDAILMTYDDGLNGLFQRNFLTGQIYAMPTVDGNQTRFNYQLTNPQTANPNDVVLLEFDIKVFDKGDDFDVTSHLMTVPLDGYYNLFSQCIFTAPAAITQNGADLLFMKNGTAFIALNGTSTLSPVLPGPLYAGTCVCAGFVFLEKGDTVGCYILNPSDVAITTLIPVSPLNYWSCYSIPN